MANSTINLAHEPVGSGGRRFNLPVDAGSHLYEGTLASQLVASGMVVPGSTAGSGKAIGMITHEVDATAGSDGDKRVLIESDKIFLFANGTGNNAVTEELPLGSPVFMADDHTVYDNDAAGTLFFAGYYMGLDPDGKVRVLVTSAGVCPAVDTGAITDSSGGAAGNGTLQAIGAAYSQAEVANNFADLAAKYNALRTALRAAGIMA